MLHNVLVIAKVLTGDAIEVKRFTVPVHNDYELETFVSDLDFRFDCVLETSTFVLISGIN